MSFWLLTNGDDKPLQDDESLLSITELMSNFTSDIFKGVHD